MNFIVRQENVLTNPILKIRNDNLHLNETQHEIIFVKTSNAAVVDVLIIRGRKVSNFHTLTTFIYSIIKSEAQNL